MAPRKSAARLSSNSNSNLLEPTVPLSTTGDPNSLLLQGPEDEGPSNDVVDFDDDKSLSGGRTKQSTVENQPPSQTQQVYQMKSEIRNPSTLSGLEVEADEESSAVSASENGSSIVSAGSGGPSQLLSPVTESSTASSNSYSTIDPQTNAQIFNTALIKDVRPRVALYDFTTEGYKSAEVRTQQWTEVGANAGQTMAFVKTRWKTLRDRFKKEYRREQNRITILWPHYSDLLFLVPFIRDRQPHDETHHLDSALYRRRTTGSDLHKCGTGTPLGTVRKGVSTANTPTSAGTAEYTEGTNKRNYRKRLNEGTIEASSDDNGDINGAGTSALLDLANKALMKEKNITSSMLTDDDVTVAADKLLNRKQTVKDDTFTQDGDKRSFDAASQMDVDDENITSHLPPKRLRSDVPAPPESPPATVSQHTSTGTLIDSVNQYHQSLMFDDMDAEDDIYCRLIMLKLKRFNGEKKERAKNSIMDTLVTLLFSTDGNDNESHTTGNKTIFQNSGRIQQQNLAGKHVFAGKVLNSPHLSLDDDAEDTIFRQLIMFKLRRFHGEKKERAKNTLMKTLVDLQFPHNDVGTVMNGQSTSIS